jgi:TldD protein
MTNVPIEPGEWALEDLTADTDEGVYMETSRSWSIDDRRLNFQFGTEIGYEIRDGKLGRRLRSCTYTGMTPQFWRSCDAVCNRSHWEVWGTPNCGKGQPGQIARTGHGGAPARFRNVQVAAMKPGAQIRPCRK